MRELGTWMRALRVPAQLGARMRALRVPALPRAPLGAIHLPGRIRAFGRQGVYAGVAVVLTAVVLALPRLTSSVAAAAPSAAPQAGAAALPPLSAYAGRFLWQGPYPTAPAGTEVQWVVGLRNTGTAGWFNDRTGATAALVLEDGTVVATPSASYVGPGDDAIFLVHFIAPATPSVRTYPMRLVILGTGTTPDLGIYANVTVTEPRSTIGGRH
jgi:hypothetical protein